MNNISFGGIKVAPTKTLTKSRVTFKLDTDFAGDLGANSARLVGNAKNLGEWGNDKTVNTEMNLLKDGTFSKTVTLDSGKDYEYKFLITDNNGVERWVADNKNNPYGLENSKFSIDDEGKLANTINISA